MQNHRIVLATVNARYSHASFGLRWLWANLGPVRDETAIREFTLSQPAIEIVESILRENPVLVGFGVYIWNVTLVTQVAQLLKTARPDVKVVIGGPEVSYEYEDMPIFAACDCLIRGEGEIAFAEVANRVLDGHRISQKVVSPDPPDLGKLALPYDNYTDEDIAHRIIYVETSRGCPFRCDFCLSSLDARVREFPLELVLPAMERLIDRGVRLFKFVDRTFNLRWERVEPILTFFHEHWRDGMQLHFEVVPDRLSEQTLSWMAQFPPGGLHLEAGVQTFNEDVLATISRKQDSEKTLQRLAWLREHTAATIHADLVLGLPGEDWDSIARGFDRLVALRPHELQVGILKRLRGTRISQNAATLGLSFAPHPPYEVLESDCLSFDQLQRLKRFARYFDLFHNSGNFPESMPLLWKTTPSPFAAFMALSDSLWATTGRTHGLPLAFLAQHLYHFLVDAGQDTPEHIAEYIKKDFHRLPGRKDHLEF